MGLSGRKVKQRIPTDPRNLTWADDAAKFGSNYLSKFGWDSSKGLGIDGDGRKSHIKVAHKLDMLGIGAAHQKDPDGIAWKQSKDFESVLKRLNEAASTQAAISVDAEIGQMVITKQKDESYVETKKKRKRMRDGDATCDGKARKKRNSHDVPPADAPGREVEELVVDQGATVAIASVEASKPYIPRHRAHRARAIASKSITSKSEACIAEILGIAPSSSTISDSKTPAGTLTSLADGDRLETLTTSSKSVADYFKEKLSTKSLKLGTPESEVRLNPDSQDFPKGGLGSAALGMQNRLVNVGHGVSVTGFLSLNSSSSLLSAAPIVNDDDASSVNRRPSKARRKEKRMADTETATQNNPHPKEPLLKNPEPPSVEERKRLKAERKARKAKRNQSPLQ